MDRFIRPLVACAIVAIALTSVLHAQHLAMPPGMTHEQHLAQSQKEAELKTRGAAAMGFDQDKTTHLFRLTAAGGTIEAGANDLSDEAIRSQIRLHLKEIAAWRALDPEAHERDQLCLRGHI